MALRKQIDVDVVAHNAAFDAPMLASTDLLKAFGAETAAVTGRSSILTSGLAAEALSVGVAYHETIGEAIKFGDTMIGVNTILGLSEQGLQKVSDQVLNLSKTTPQSADALGKGLGLAAQAGFNVADSMKITAESAKLATAGMTDQSTATQAVTAVLNAYGLSAASATHVSNVLFETSKLGGGSLASVASGMQGVAAIAAGAHIPIEQVGAAIATMGRAGVPDAINALPRILKLIIEPVGAMKAAIHEMGFENGAAALQTLGLNGVLEKLAGIVGGSPAAFEALFSSVRAQKAAFALLANDGRTLAQVYADMQAHLNGAVERAYTEQMKSLGNELKTTLNNVHAWGIEIGSHALPAVAGLTHGLGAFVDVMRVGTSFVAQHKEIVEALALLYGAKLAVALAGTVANLAGVAGGWLATAAAEIVATAATEGIAVALGGLLLLTAPLALALGAVFAIESWQHATAAAKAYVDQLERGKDASTVLGRQQITASLNEASNSFDKGGKVASGWFQTMQAGAETIIPFFGHGLRDTQLKYDALTQAQEKNSEARKNEIDNVLALHQATGLSADAIRSRAAGLNIDLTGAVDSQQSKDARQSIIEDFDKMKDAIGLTDAQVVQLGDNSVTKMKDIMDAAGKAGAAMESAFSLTKGLDLGPADPKKKADDVAAAQDTLAQAQDRVAAAQDKINQNERFLIRTPQRDRELATAKRELIKATEEEQKAQQKLTDAKTRQTDPGKLIEDQYKKQIDTATNFLKNIDIVSKQGADPAFLAKALADPEKYGPILDAMAHDTSGHLTKIVNDSEGKLKQLEDRSAVMAGKITEAVKLGFSKMPEDLQAAMDQALTGNAAQVHDLALKLGFDSGAAYAKGFSQGAAQGSASGPDQYGRKPGDPQYGADRPVPGTAGGPYGPPANPADNVTPHNQGSSDPNYTGPPNPAWRAEGGIDAHIATSTSYIYAEPGTGGEAFIPMGLAHRERSTMLLADVAKQFGYGLVRHMDDGGYVMGGGVSHAVSNYGPQTTTYSKRGGDMHIRIDKVVAHDYHDFEQQMERKQRLAALAGGE